jgi:trimethylamine:corrinoid methyltransferase-like protein
VREDWEARGGTDLYARCHAKAREILADYQPPQLDDDVKRRIRAIVEDTDRAVGVTSPA